MKSICILAFFPAAVALAQAASCTYFWEANDGAGWTRSQLSTSNSQVQVRLVAQWVPLNGRGFGATQFDVAISGSNVLDTATNIRRPEPFDFFAQIVVATRQGSTIKLDDSRDVAAPGLGTFWISTAQSNGDFGEHVNNDNPVTLFTFDLSFGGADGIRHVGSLHHVFGNNVNTTIWSPLGANLDVLAQSNGIDIHYIPSPMPTCVLTSGLLLALRSRSRVRA